MPDSEAKIGTLSEATTTRALREAVTSLYNAGKLEELTVKRVRTEAEQKLNLQTGFFKSDEIWKQKSHDIIHATVEQCTAEPLDEPEPEKKEQAPRSKSAKAAPNKAALKKAVPATESPRGVKRRAPVEKKTQKRRKTAVSSDEESDLAEESRASEDTISKEEYERPKKRAPARRKKVVKEDSEEDAASDEDVKPKRKTAQQKKKVQESELEDEAEATPPKATRKVKPASKESPSDEESKHAALLKQPEPETKPEVTGDASESELSSLIDDELPARKRGQKKSPTEKVEKAAAAPKSKTKAPAKSKAAKDIDPNEAEMKRLQGWLVKCGIKKVWSKELAKFDTSKAKINHLKGMLKDAGMDGKPSIEKAARIKEQREFAADLEAIKEGEKQWGLADEEVAGRPRRRLVRAVKRTAPVIRDEEDDSGNEEDEEGNEEATPESEEDSKDSEEDSD
ncbi:hypothetical protein GQ43DRAFT_60758 [Delitschia confertaspora ATCC 74209]|uniref:DEK C-terminal domain-containing protein n=1 Tax=Delitschia confertaspora ATCC 74209 TaxID=1513339 RepID=A0A9P4JJV5_9PLEO|nr:hypothetical protein GQ43DRAFT_60758 [Delitschia confertaspora ATCC 74209]